MWSYVKVPPFSDAGRDMVCLAEHCVQAGATVQRDSPLAIVHSYDCSWEIRSNYAGKLLKWILEPHAMATVGDSIATLELGEDPDARMIQYCKKVE